MQCTEEKTTHNHFAPLSAEHSRLVTVGGEHRTDEQKYLKIAIKMNIMMRRTKIARAVINYCIALELM